jgi:hypothetical protein
VTINTHHHARAVGHHLETLRHIPVQVLQDQEVGKARHQVHGGHLSHRTQRAGVRSHHNVVGLSHVRQLEHLPEPTSSACVRLHYIDDFLLDQLPHPMHACVAFPGSDGQVHVRRYLGEGVKVLGCDRVFIEEQAVRFERLA